MNCWICERATSRKEVPIRGGGKDQVNCCDYCDFHFFPRDNTTLLTTNQLDQTRLARAGLEIPEIALDYENGLKQAAGYIQDYLTESDIGKNILEVGCSWGYFLDLVKKKGAHPYGLELNPVRAHYVRKLLNISCYQTLEELEATHLTFHKIFAFYVLEYIANPKVYLKRLHDLLQPGGQLIIITPNLDDLIKDIWQNPGFINFFYDETAIAYYSVRALNNLTAIFTELSSCAIKTKQGYSFINHLSWYLTQKPRTTGMVGGDRYVNDISVTLSSNSHELGQKLANLIELFDRQYRESIELHGWGNQIICKLVKGKNQ